MESKKFDPAKLAKLNDPKRLEYLDADRIWGILGSGGISTVVDIGAGTGFFAILFAKKNESCRVFACDILDVMIRWMSEHLPPELAGRVVPVKMDENAVPLPGDEADLVYMINLHHELDEPRRLLRESHRLLRCGGRLAVIDWRRSETPEGPPVEIRVTREDIMEQMDECGFSRLEWHDFLPYHNFVTGNKA